METNLGGFGNQEKIHPFLETMKPLKEEFRHIQSRYTLLHDREEFEIALDELVKVCTKVFNEYISKIIEENTLTLWDDIKPFGIYDINCYTNLHTDGIIFFDKEENLEIVKKIQKLAYDEYELNSLFYSFYDISPFNIFLILLNENKIPIIKYYDSTKL